MRLTLLFPPRVGLRLDDLTTDDRGIIRTVHATRRTAHCLICGRRSARVHGRYWRSLADRPGAGERVTLRLQVRRFVCRPAACPRTIFAERFPGLTAAHARRTDAQRFDVPDLGFTLGERPGARRDGGLAPSCIHMALNRPYPPDTLARDHRGQMWGDESANTECVRFHQQGRWAGISPDCSGAAENGAEKSPFGVLSGTAFRAKKRRLLLGLTVPDPKAQILLDTFRVSGHIGELAAWEYDAKARELFGELAYQNLPARTKE